MLQEYLHKVVSGYSLTEAEAEAAMGIIMSGEATPAQIGAFLTALRLKRETVEEITGFARTMRRLAEPLNIRHRVLVDTCGTGGDGRHTFNISTAAAFVVAGAGIPVAKHGNRSVSSRAGSADVLEALGVRVDLSPSAVAACLEKVGIAFLFAPAFHKAMRHAAAPRREIGIRTVFNLLGPLTNPAGAPYQLVGVYAPELTETVATVLGRLGCRRAFVVHGSDGLDEVTITGPTKVTRLENNVVETFTFYPEEVGIKPARPKDLSGGTAADNAGIIREVLEGRPGPARDVVVLNAAFALLAAGAVASVQEGMKMAEESIDSGAAYGKLAALVSFSESGAA
ncbi:MAG: anthranilate phosphoribosyltransferase [Moorellaceae bacterium]